MKRVRFLFVWLLLWGSVALFAHDVIPLSREQAEHAFVVRSGESVVSVSRRLETEGIIRNRFSFLALLAVTRSSRTVRAGTFTFPERVSMRDVRRILRMSSGRVEISIIIPEGWTLREIARVLEDRGIGASEAFESVAYVENFRDDFPDLLASVPSDRSLEGYLFPDTYRFYPESDPRSVIARMLQRFDEVMENEKLTFTYDDVVLASIIEREVPESEDRKIVADIFLKRLRVDMPLQADSTLNYETGGTNRASYNTYRVRGIPPGPISNPGLDALRAVKHPRTSPYWYFLSGTDGVTRFARTLAEHNENIRLFLR